ncbi:MAG: spore photoproduct lyase family protein [Spirochaetota bacterium]
MKPIGRLKVSYAMKIGMPSVKTKQYKLLDGTFQVLVQQVGDGSIIKRFEKTPFPTEDTDVVCPHFLELKWAYGCPFNCAWCYLKGTLRLLPTKTKPVVKKFDKIEEHLQVFFRKSREKEILNTGELADSLMYESNSTPFSKFVIPLFESQNRHRVLFLTKSNRIENLLSIEKHSRTTVSFSINAEPVSEKWEKAPSVRDRIEAAKRVTEAGYETRIRIDPIVPISDWKKHYCNIIDFVLKRFVPERITLGTLRGLQSTINEARDKSWTEFLSDHSNWGRKISSNLRRDLYSEVIRYLMKEYDYDKVALCKETLAMWKALGMDYTCMRCNCTW